MNVYTLPDAQRCLPALLEQAIHDGTVLVRDACGRTFSIKLETPAGSPLDVAGLPLNLDADEIVDVVRESRDRGD